MHGNGQIKKLGGGVEIHRRKTRLAVFQRSFILGVSALVFTIGSAVPAPDAAKAQEVCDVAGAADGTASGTDAFACGPESIARGTEATAVGDAARVGTTGTGNADNGTAIGGDSNAWDRASTALGSHAQAGTSNSNQTDADAAIAIGGGNGGGSAANATNEAAIAIGAWDGTDDGGPFSDPGRDAGTDATGVGSIAIGTRADSLSDGGVALGYNANVTGTNGVAMGAGANAAGPGDISIGANSSVASDMGTTMGTGSTIGTGSMYASTYGANTSVGPDAPGAVAIGTDSDGNGAAATLPNQYVMGTTMHTYTAPGITSATSKARQSGPLEVVTSDANGNLASDGGAIFSTLDDHETRISKNSADISRNSADISKNRADIRENRNQIRKLGNQVDENQEGVAVAMSVNGPDLVTNESFGVSFQWAGFESGNAIGSGFTGVVYRDEQYRFALTGGIGVGLDEGTVGGRAGGQLTW